MKRILKGNLEFLIISILSFLIAIAIFYIGGEKDGKKEVALAVLITGLSLSVGVKQLQIENDKMFKDLFTAFNKKYDKDFNNLLNDIERRYKVNKDFKIDDNERNTLIDYINFCAEEYLWYTKNRIDENVWKSWKNGMIYYLNIPPINDFIQTEKGQSDSYYGLFKEIGKDIVNWN